MQEENKICYRTMNVGTSISIPTYLVGVFVKIFSKKQGEKVCDLIKKIDFKTKDKVFIQAGLVPACIDEEDECKFHHEAYLGLKL
jgi:hypothetical protein